MPNIFDEKFNAIRETLDAGTCIAIASADMGIITIHDIPNASHMGFGFFKGSTDSGLEIQFDAGGAMRRLKVGEHTLSWTPVHATPEAYDELLIDVDEQKQWLIAWIDKARCTEVQS